MYLSTCSELVLLLQDIFMEINGNKTRMLQDLFKTTNCVANETGKHKVIGEIRRSRNDFSTFNLHRKHI